MKAILNRAVALYTARLFNFHISIMLLLLQRDYFLTSLVSVHLHKNQSLEERQQQAVIIVQARLVTLPLCSGARRHRNPFVLLIMRRMSLHSTCCIKAQQTTKALSQFHMCPSQFEYFHQQLGSLPNLHGSGSQQSGGEGEPKERHKVGGCGGEGGQARESSMFAFLRQWCMTSLSHPADCLLGLHAHTWTEMIPPCHTEYFHCPPVAL